MVKNGKFSSAKGTTKQKQVNLDDPYTVCRFREKQERPFPLSNSGYTLSQSSNENFINLSSSSVRVSFKRPFVISDTNAMDIIGDTRYMTFMSFFIGNEKSASKDLIKFDLDKDGKADFKNMFVKNPPFPKKEWKYKLQEPKLKPEEPVK